MNDVKKSITLVDDIYWPTTSLHTLGPTKETLKMFDALRPYVKNTKTMVQAGGNCGLTLRPFVDIFESIYTFEPDPINFACLCLNVTNDNVYKMQSCVGETHKLINLNYVGTDCGSAHISSSGNIPTLKIDDLNLNDCDLIMLDVEGYEMYALMGAEQTITKFHPVICVEVYNDWMNRYNYSYPDLVAYLSKFGYNPVNYYRTSYSTDVIFSL
jgi:FkbM family methyltransferase